MTRNEHQTKGTTMNNFPYITAWGEYLGFSAENIASQLQMAAAENAPHDAIQKRTCDGSWMTLSDIKNETNRNRVIALAKE